MVTNLANKSCTCSLVIPRIAGVTFVACLVVLWGAAFSSPVTSKRKKSEYDIIVTLFLCCVLFVHLWQSEIVMYFDDYQDML